MNEQGGKDNDPKGFDNTVPFTALCKYVIKYAINLKRDIKNL